MYPRLLSAIAEGVYLLAAERNPNTVKMTSYAPSLMNRDWYNWTPDMISFEALQTATVRSASYWLQWLFSHYRGTQTLPITASGGQINPLYWVATIDEQSGTIYVKVINTLNDTVPLNLQFTQQYHSVNGTILTAPDLNSYNYINNMTVVTPQPIDFSGSNSSSSYGTQGTFQWDVPKFSVNVLQFNCQ